MTRKLAQLFTCVAIMVVAMVISLTPKYHAAMPAVSMAPSDFNGDSILLDPEISSGTGNFGGNLYVSNLEIDFAGSDAMGIRIKNLTSSVMAINTLYIQNTDNYSYSLMASTIKFVSLDGSISSNTAGANGRNTNIPADFDGLMVIEWDQVVSIKYGGTSYDWNRKSDDLKLKKDSVDVEDKYPDTKLSFISIFFNKVAANSGVNEILLGDVYTLDYTNETSVKYANPFKIENNTVAGSGNVTVSNYPTDVATYSFEVNGVAGTSDEAIDLNVTNNMTLQYGYSYTLNPTVTDGYTFSYLDIDGTRQTNLVLSNNSKTATTHVVNAVTASPYVYTIPGNTEIDISSMSGVKFDVNNMLGEEIIYSFVMKDTTSNEYVASNNGVGIFVEKDGYTYYGNVFSIPVGFEGSIYIPFNQSRNGVYGAINNYPFDYGNSKPTSILSTISIKYVYTENVNNETLANVLDNFSFVGSAPVLSLAPSDGKVERDFSDGIGATLSASYNGSFSPVPALFANVNGTLPLDSLGIGLRFANQGNNPITVRIYAVGSDGTYVPSASHTYYRIDNKTGVVETMSVTDRNMVVPANFDGTFVFNMKYFSRDNVANEISSISFKGVNVVRFNIYMNASKGDYLLLSKEVIYYDKAGVKQSIINALSDESTSVGNIAAASVDMQKIVYRDVNAQVDGQANDNSKIEINTDKLAFGSKLVVSPKEGYVIASATLNGEAMIENLDGSFFTTVAAPIDSANLVVTTSQNFKLTLVHDETVEVSVQDADPNHLYESGTIIKLGLILTEGYEVVSVKKGNEELVAVDEVYSFTITDNTIVTVVTKVITYEVEYAITGNDTLGDKSGVLFDVNNTLGKALNYSFIMKDNSNSYVADDNGVGIFVEKDGYTYYGNIFSIPVGFEGKVFLPFNQVRGTTWGGINNLPFDYTNKPSSVLSNILLSYLDGTISLTDFESVFSNFEFVTGAPSLSKAPTSILDTNYDNGNIVSLDKTLVGSFGSAPSVTLYPDDSIPLNSLGIGFRVANHGNNDIKFRLYMTGDNEALYVPVAAPTYSRIDKDGNVYNGGGTRDIIVPAGFDGTIIVDLMHYTTDNLNKIGVNGSNIDFSEIIIVNFRLYLNMNANDYLFISPTVMTVGLDGEVQNYPGTIDASRTISSPAETSGVMYTPIVNSVFYEDVNLTVDGLIDDGSKISVSHAELTLGDVIVVAPKSGYAITEATFNGISMTENLDGSFSYRITSVITEATVAVTTVQKVKLSFAYDDEMIEITVDNASIDDLYEVNALISFTVTALEGYEIISVKKGNEVLSLVDGKYSFNITETTVVTVEAKIIVYEVEFELGSENVALEDKLAIKFDVDNTLGKVFDYSLLLKDQDNTYTASNFGVGIFAENNGNTYYGNVFSIPVGFKGTIYIPFNQQKGAYGTVNNYPFDYGNDKPTSVVNKVWFNYLNSEISSNDLKGIISGLEFASSMPSLSKSPTGKIESNFDNGKIITLDNTLVGFGNAPVVVFPVDNVPLNNLGIGFRVKNQGVNAISVRVYFTGTNNALYVPLPNQTYSRIDNEGNVWNSTGNSRDIVIPVGFDGTIIIDIMMYATDGLTIIGDTGSNIDFEGISIKSVNFYLNMTKDDYLYINPDMVTYDLKSVKSIAETAMDLDNGTIRAVTVSGVTYTPSLLNIVVNEPNYLVDENSYDGTKVQLNLEELTLGDVLTITPKAGFVIKSAMFNGTPMTKNANGSYSIRIVAGMLDGVVSIEIETEERYLLTFDYDNTLATISIDGGTLEDNDYESGTVVNFTVAPINGYQIVSVKYGNIDVSLSDGVYSITISSDIEIKVIVEAINYTITYNLDGGTNASSNKTSYTVNDAFSFADASKSGYEFVRWYVLNENNEKVDIVRIIKGSTGNLNLYAEYKEVVVPPVIEEPSDEPEVLPGWAVGLIIGGSVLVVAGAASFIIIRKRKK